MNSKNNDNLKWYEVKSKRNYHQNAATTSSPSVRSHNQRGEVRQKTEFAFTPSKNALVAALSQDMFNFTSLPQDAKEVLEDLQNIVYSTHPLTSKQKATLPQEIRDLCHKLTDERQKRVMGYMNTPKTLTAYVHYYLWWNLVRLTRLFSNMDKSFFNLKDNDTCLDLGSGPLTVPIALYLARPELRAVPLVWLCQDVSPLALSFGEDIFLSIVARLKGTEWKIIKIKEPFGTNINSPVKLVTSANLFNELLPGNKNEVQALAKSYVDTLTSYTKNSGTAAEGSKILVIEPGVPKTAGFISLLRENLIEKDFYPISPCPHRDACPMNGDKGRKWCNFSFSTEDAPLRLKKLSEEAHLSKERAVLSFIAAEYMGKDSNIERKNEFTLRITSDPIRLSSKRMGYYACSSKGLLLVITNDTLSSGQCLALKEEPPLIQKDAKSGAFIIEVKLPCGT